MAGAKTKAKEADIAVVVGKPKRPSRAAVKAPEAPVAEMAVEAAPAHVRKPSRSVAAEPVVAEPTVAEPAVAKPAVAASVVAKAAEKTVAPKSGNAKSVTSKPIVAKIAPPPPVVATPVDVVIDEPVVEEPIAELDGAPEALAPKALGLSDALEDVDPAIDLAAVEDDPDALDVPALPLDDDDDDTPEPPRAAGTPPPPRSARPIQQGPIMNRPIQISRASNKDETFAEGDHVVYPTHGVGRVEKIATEEIAGHKLELIHITFEENRMTLRVPVAKARSAGLRKLATRKLFDEALAVLRGRARIKRTMWSRRAQEYDAKINSGDPLQIAEVVRDLHRNAGQPDQSFSERQIYEAAMDRLSAELGALDGIDKLAASNKLTAFLKTIA